MIGAAVLVLALILSRVEDEQHRGGPLQNPRRRRAPRRSTRPSRGSRPSGQRDRTYYGEGPVPLDPVIGWRVPRSGCAPCPTWGSSGATGVAPGGPASPTWSWVRTGRSRCREGATTGCTTSSTGRRACRSGRRSRRVICEGSATSDPDGFPLYYAGSRDGRFRIVATDRKEPLVLWSVDGATSVDRPLRNDDWDEAALVVDDVLFEGGENGWLYVIRLNRRYDELHLVRVAPEIVATVPGFDDELLRVLDDEEVSIENSVALHDGILYFANSGGLVQGGTSPTCWRAAPASSACSGSGRATTRTRPRDRRCRRPLCGQRVSALRRPEPRGRPADEARPLASERSTRLVDRGRGRSASRAPEAVGRHRRCTATSSSSRPRRGRVLAVERETGDISRSGRWGLRRLDRRWWWTAC